MVNILVWTKRSGAVKADLLEKKFSKRAKFTNDRIVRLNRYKIRTNHTFHLKFCTVAPYILTNKTKRQIFFLNFALIYAMTSIIYSNLCKKSVNIQHVMCNPCVCPTGYEFKYFKSIV